MSGWFLAESNGEGGRKRIGPFSSEKALQMAESGRLTEESLVSHEKHTKGQFVPAGKLSGFARKFEARDELESQRLQEEKAARREAAQLAKREAAANAAAAIERESARKAQELANAPYARFLAEGQDPSVLEKAYGQVADIMTDSESLIYMAVAKHLPGFQSPDCAVATSRRFMVVRQKMLGRMSFDDYLWEDLFNARLNQGMMFSAISFQTADGAFHKVECLPKLQAKKLYSICQRHEENAREVRRQKDLEERRASSGGFNFAPPPSTAPAQAATPAAVDPVEKLASLKKMLDAGLIEQGEYDAKKAEVLAQM